MEGFDQIQKDHESHQRSKRTVDGIYQFNAEPHHILSSALKNNPISGITLPRLLKLLFFKRYSVDWWRYKHRILALFFMGIFNSFLEFLESIYMFYLCHINWNTRKLIDVARQDAKAPVFVLGHPRTGTTLLHSLLALDEERFTFCDTFMVGFPHCFLFFERWGKFLFSGILSETRPMDNMKLHFDLPQEDELATNLLSGCMVSPYNSIVFMREEEQYRKFQCFLEKDTPRSDVITWTRLFRNFLFKIKVRDILRARQKSPEETGNGKSHYHDPIRRLLLKSPCHTGRARLLTKLFPGSKFIFIHRNPYEVFLSGSHMASTTYGYWFLQEPNSIDIQKYILCQGEILHREVFSCLDDGVLNDKNCVQISFESLTTDPVGTMKRIYSGLGFDSFEEESNSSYPSRLQKECQTLKDYKPNFYPTSLFDESLMTTIELRWKEQFERFGYDRVY